MLGPICELLAGRRVILASGSVRRKQILENIGFPFEVVPSQFEETLDKALFSTPWQYALETSRGKATEVAKKLQDQSDWVVVVGADTIVDLDGQILEKPGTAEKARHMLQSLSGRTHIVHTGVTLVWRGGGGVLQERGFHETTEVTFATLSEEVLEFYIASGEPLDKAGGYGIQALGATLVSGLKGDYFNVEGLPVHRLCTELMDVLKI